MTTGKPVHHILGISDKREEEIAKEVIDTLTEHKFVDVGIEKLMQKYDAEALLAGMRLMQAIRLNNATGDAPAPSPPTCIERQRALQKAERN